MELPRQHALKCNERVLEGGDERRWLRLRQQQHLRRENLGHSPNARGHREQPARHCLDDCDAERLCQGRVEEDLPAIEDLADLRVLQLPQHLHTVEKRVTLDHLHQLQPSRPVAADHELHLRVPLADCGDNVHEQVGAFAIHKPRDDHNRYRAGALHSAAPSPVLHVLRRREGGRVSGVWYHAHVLGGDVGAKHRVLLRGVADADDLVDAAEGPLQHLVDVDRRAVRESEKRVVREAHLQAHRRRVHERLVAHVRCRLVPMYNCNPLSDENRAQQRKHCKECRQRDDARWKLHPDERKVVHLEAVIQVPDAVVSLAVRTRDDDDLMAAAHQTVRHIVDVDLHPAEAGIEEIGDKRDSMGTH
eukprot:PhM_4_TR6288/c5_g3_i1/m.93833